MKQVQVSLLDKNGEVQYGLNWGQRENREPNQAYLQLSPEIYRGDFFPPKGKYFIVNTDDNETIIFNRAQKDLGCALQTPESNSLLGLYIRRRLGVLSGKEITKEDIERSGNSFFTFSKIDDMHYTLNFGEYKLAVEKNATVNQPLQQIFYGAPGTGKSHSIKKVCKEYEHFRITFHPDTDYASFVGSYKPTVKPIKMRDVTGKVITEGTTEVTEDKIIYSFVKQAFLKAYIAAWKEKKNPEPKPVFLVIEEINRGNCAQIFGDIFQLLDRNDYGFSDYPISTDSDLEIELRKNFENLEVANADSINAIFEDDIVAKIKSGSHLLLPNNLYIWATMNTSDQSLFPMDSAFKRRWDWKYIKISDSGKNYRIKVNDNEYDWWEFVDTINSHIGTTTSQEDKKLGYFFAKSSDGIITAEKFLSKVLFFLYGDVYKDYGFDDDIFKDENGDILTFANYFNEFGDIVPEKVERFIQNLGLKPLTFKEATDLDGDNPLPPTLKARVNGIKVWTITYAFYQILKAISNKYTYDELVTHVDNYINRTEPIMKTIESPDTYEKEKQWYNYKPLTTKDGLTFVITNQWKKEYIPQLMALAKAEDVSYEELPE